MMNKDLDVNMIDPVVHYVKYGYKEGRNAKFIKL